MISEVTAVSESPMRFFTPEVCLRVNSANDQVADSAQAEWDSAVAAYRNHLKKVLRNAPPGIGALATACFHDANVVSLKFESLGREPLPYLFPEPLLFFTRRTGPATVKLTLPNKSVALVYLIWDEVRTHAASAEWEKRTGARLWLYDEIDEVWSRFGMFVHRILFNNGEVWEIPFTDVVQVEVAIPELTPSKTRT